MLKLSAVLLSCGSRKTFQLSSISYAVFSGSVLFSLRHLFTCRSIKSEAGVKKIKKVPRGYQSLNNKTKRSLWWTLIISDKQNSLPSYQLSKCFQVELLHIFHTISALLLLIATRLSHKVNERLENKNKSQLLAYTRIPLALLTWRRQNKIRE